MPAHHNADGKPGVPVTFTPGEARALELTLGLLGTFAADHDATVALLRSARAKVEAARRDASGDTDARP